MRPRAALIELRRTLVPVLRGDRGLKGDEGTRLAELVFDRYRVNGEPWTVDSRTRFHALELALALGFDVSHDLEAPIDRRLHPRTLRTALRASLARQNPGAATAGG